MAGKTVTDPATRAELDRLGYKVHHGDGSAYAIARKPGVKNDLPHLGVDELTGTLRRGSGDVRPNFRERANIEGAEWDQRSTEFANLETRLGKADSGMTAEDRAVGHVTIQKAAPEFRGLLAKRIDHAGLDKGGAGMLARWGRPMEELVAKAEMSGHRLGLAALADELLAGIPMPLTEAGYDLFRHRLRTKTVDVLHGIEDGTERMKMLHEMIAVQPESSSMGHLFSEYSTRDMTAAGTVTVQQGTPKAFTGADLRNTRKPDRAGRVSELQSGATGLPKGRNALEDKTGRGAFKIEQAEDYTKRGTPGEGFRLTSTSTTTEYDNVVYVFSNEIDATNAAVKLRGNSGTRAILERSPGGIHVAFYDEQSDRSTTPGCEPGDGSVLSSRSAERDARQCCAALKAAGVSRSAARS